MSQVWSEVNKVVNVLDLKSQSASSGDTIDTDIVHLENYKKLTYLITLGSAGVKNMPTVTVYGGETSSSAAAAIAFRYRTQVTGRGGSSGTTGSDVPSSLSTASSSFTISSGANSGMYIVEVDPPTVAAVDTTDQTYDHVKLRFTNATGVGQIYGVTAVLSEPRYPQDVLVTAID